MVEKTTISMRQDVHDRFLGAKPFDSMSHSEMVDYLLDVYEDVGGEFQ